MDLISEYGSVGGGSAILGKAAISKCVSLVFAGGATLRRQAGYTLGFVVHFLFLLFFYFTLYMHMYILYATDFGE